MEQIARIAREGVPKPLGPSQVDPVTGQINWPSALQEDSFEAQRGQVEQLFDTRARYGGLGYSDQMKVRQVTDSMFHELKAQIRADPAARLCRVSEFSAELDVRRHENRTGIRLVGCVKRTKSSADWCVSRTLHEIR